MSMLTHDPLILMPAMPRPLPCRPAEGSLAWVEQSGRTPMPHAVFRASAIGRMGGNSLSLDLPANVSDLVSGRGSQFCGWRCCSPAAGML